MIRVFYFIKKKKMLDFKLIKKYLIKRKKSKIYKNFRKV